MTTDRTSITRFGVAAGTVLVAALLSGCAGSHVRSASSALPEQNLAKADVKADKAIARAEQAVLRSPQAAATRTALGQAYLAAGRFDSAAIALDDAMTLGDNSGRTALSLALAWIGQGRFQDAVSLLDDWRTEIPASDLGLALALSGETSRGVAVLADALRGGDNTSKLRQNLAYAYALDGRWQESRLMAAQDVPADQLERRMAFWALSTLPDRNSERVAALLGSPMRRDPGQPAALALKIDPAKEQLATETAAGTVASPAAPAAELPVVAAAEPAPVGAVVSANLAAQTTPVLAPTPVRPSVFTARTTVAQAFGPAPVAAARVVARSGRVAIAVRPAVAAVGAGTHLVQLGSFSSPQGARRAWGIYTRHDRALASYRMTIVPANVRGKNVWRVAAGGIGGKLAANGLCSSLKARGGSCFAYATPLNVAPAPATPMRGPVGPQMVRRR